MRVLSKILIALAWIIEAVGGLFFPLLLVFSALFVNTNENNRLIDIPGFPFVIAALFIAAVLMLVGLVFFHKKQRKTAYILMISAAALFVVGLAVISVCCMHPSGAVSLKVTGEFRLTALKLVSRHATPILIPVLAWLSAVCVNKAEDKELFAEAIREIQEGK